MYLVQSQIKHERGGLHVLKPREDLKKPADKLIYFIVYQQLWMALRTRSHQLLSNLFLLKNFHPKGPAICHRLWRIQLEYYVPPPSSKLKG